MRATIPRLMTAYHTRRRDPSAREPRMASDTSGHRGSALDHASVGEEIFQTGAAG